MKVFLVGEGEYEDWHIVAVFSDEPTANKYSDVIGGEVEEFEVNEEVGKLKELINRIENGYGYYQVRMELITGDNAHTEILIPRIAEDSEITVNKWGIIYMIHQTIWARSEQEAIKILNDRRIERRAGNEEVHN